MIGETISHYRILNQLGVGGMGVVFCAEDLSLGRTVALKFISETLACNPQALERFEREARAASALDHPNICTVYEIGKHEGKPFIAMQYLEGQTLKQRLNAAPMESHEALQLAGQIAEALAAAHAKGIVHRDIKPSNIFLTRQNQVKVLDFGLARLPQMQALDPAAPTGDVELDTAQGTLPYMAPEQLLGMEVDGRADLYSLGVLLYELCTGRRPFEEKLSTALVNDILHRRPEPPGLVSPGGSARLDRMILRCLEKKPAQRFSSAEELRAEIQRILEPEATEPSLAVLYFENLGGALEDEYFRDGMTEDVITELTKIRGLRVLPRSAVAAFRDRPVTAPVVGQQLGAEYVLGGSLRRVGNRVRITAQLVSAQNGFSLWGDRFDFEMADLFAMQDQIAHSISSALQISLSPQEERALASRPTGSPRAYDFYLRGRGLARRSTHADLELAIEMYGRAIELDSQFAPAYGGIAIACALLYDWHEKNSRWLEKAEEACARAEQIDPNIPEILAARARICWSQHNYDQAIALARQAIEIKPDCENAYWTLGQSYFASDRWANAAALVERAIGSSGHDYNVYVPLIMALERLGRFTEASRLRLRQLEVMERHVERVPEDVRAHILMANAFASLGKAEASVKHLKTAMGLRPHDSNVLYNAACTYGVLGQPAEALGALRQAVAAGFDAFDYAARDPDLSCIHSEPEFKKFLQQQTGKPASSSAHN